MHIERGKKKIIQPIRRGIVTGLIVGSSLISMPDAKAWGNPTGCEQFLRSYTPDTEQVLEDVITQLHGQSYIFADKLPDPTEAKKELGEVSRAIDRDAVVPYATKDTLHALRRSLPETPPVTFSSVSTHPFTKEEATLQKVEGNFHRLVVFCEQQVPKAVRHDAWEDLEESYASPAWQYGVPFGLFIAGYFAINALVKREE